MNDRGVPVQLAQTKIHEWLFIIVLSKTISTPHTYISLGKKLLKLVENPFWISGFTANVPITADHGYTQLLQRVTADHSSNTRFSTNHARDMLANYHWKSILR